MSVSDLELLNKLRRTKTVVQGADYERTIKLKEWLSQSDDTLLAELKAVKAEHALMYMSVVATRPACSEKLRELKTDQEIRNAFISAVLLIKCKTNDTAQAAGRAVGFGNNGEWTDWSPVDLILGWQDRVEALEAFLLPHRSEDDLKWDESTNVQVTDLEKIRKIMDAKQAKLPALQCKERKTALAQWGHFRNGWEAHSSPFRGNATEGVLFDAANELAFHMNCLGSVLLDVSNELPLAFVNSDEHPAGCWHSVMEILFNMHVWYQQIEHKRKVTPGGYTSALQDPCKIVRPPLYSKEELSLMNQQQQISKQVFGPKRSGGGGGSGGKSTSGDAPRRNQPQQQQQQQQQRNNPKPGGKRGRGGRGGGPKPPPKTS